MGFPQQHRVYPDALSSIMEDHHRFVVAGNMKRSPTSRRQRIRKLFSRIIPKSSSSSTLSTSTASSMDTASSVKVLTLGGVYATASDFDFLSFEDDADAADEENNYDEEDESSSSDYSDLTPVPSDLQSISSSSSIWTSSGSAQHNQNTPLIALPAEAAKKKNNEQVIEIDEAELLGKAMARSRQLPKHSGVFSNNHIMVNSERSDRLVAPLHRHRTLDELAREHAADMARQHCLSYSRDIASLIARLSGGEDVSVTRIAQNVAKGDSIQNIHKTMMANVADKNNILDRRLAKFGMGTATAEDGTLYMCQLFMA